MDTEAEVLELLGNQHRRIRELVREAATCPVAAREERVAELVRFITAHDGAVLVATHPRGEAATDPGARLLGDPDVVDLLDRLDDLGPSSRGFARRLEGLERALDRHAGIEERVELPLFFATHVGEDCDRALGALRSVDEMAADDAPGPPAGLRSRLRDACAATRRRLDDVD